MSNIKVTTNKIKSIIPLYPEIVSDEAIDKIKEEYYDLLDLEELLYRSRETTRTLENKLKENKDAFNKKTMLFTIEFEVEEKKAIQGESTPLMMRDGRVIKW